MIEIFHAPGTRGYRAIWACEEIGTPYSVVPVDMAPAYRFSDEFRRLNPTGKVPVLRDGDLVMFESCAMVQYLLAKYGAKHDRGALEPDPGTAAHALCLQWGWFAEATFARPLGEIVNHRRAFGDKARTEITDEMAGRARLCAESLDGALQGKTYLLGDEFSSADIMMGYTLRIYQRLLAEALPGNLAAYWTALQARPAFKATEAADAAAV